MWDDLIALRNLVLYTVEAVVCLSFGIFFVLLFDALWWSNDLLVLLEGLRP